MKSVKEQVDALLKEGADHPEKWMSVRALQKVQPASDEMYDWEYWEGEYEVLHKHHLAETAALLDIIKELVKRVSNV